MFGKIGTMELILILFIALVLFGPGKLPDIGKAFGKAINEFKTQANKVSKDLEVELEDKEKENKEA